MKDLTPTSRPTSIRQRLRRFITDREKVDYLFGELVELGILVFIAGWPIVLLASTMARMPR